MQNVCKRARVRVVAGSWGPAIVGACNDEVNEALKAQIDKGTSFGAPCELEVRLQQKRPCARWLLAKRARCGLALPQR